MFVIYRLVSFSLREEVAVKVEELGKGCLACRALSNCIFFSLTRNTRDREGAVLSVSKIRKRLGLPFGNLAPWKVSENPWCFFSLFLVYECLNNEQGPHSAAPVATVWLSGKYFCLPWHSQSPGGCAWLTSSEFSGIQMTMQAEFTAQIEHVEMLLQAVKKLSEMH